MEMGLLKKQGNAYLIGQVKPKIDCQKGIPESQSVRIVNDLVEHVLKAL